MRVRVRRGRTNLTIRIDRETAGFLRELARKNKTNVTAIVRPFVDSIVASFRQRAARDEK